MLPASINFKYCVYMKRTERELLHVGVRVLPVHLARVHLEWKEKAGSQIGPIAILSSKSANGQQFLPIQLNR